MDIQRRATKAREHIRPTNCSSKSKRHNNHKPFAVQYKTTSHLMSVFLIPFVIMLT
jgi:hypothetical protein